MKQSLYPRHFKELIDHISRLPGIGRKSAEKMALAIYQWPTEKISAFAAGISELKSAVTNCPRCGFFSEDHQLCSLCRHPERQSDLICVVEQPSQINVFEKSSSFKGLYHVLHGKLSPMSGIGPEDLQIDALIERCRAEQVQEVILATGTDLEGQATASYLAKQLEPLGITVSRIALGIPVGADLNYADAASIALAIDKRRTF